MPGRILTRIARTFCARATCDRVLEPLVADLQHDWSERASGAARIGRLLSGYAAFWIAFTVCTARTGVTRDREGVAPRRLDATVAYLLAAAAPGAIHVAGFGGRLVDETVRDALPAIGWGAAFALLPALMRARWSPAVEWRRGATQICLAWAVSVCVLVGWVQPALAGISLAPRISPAQQPYYAALEPVSRVLAIAVGSPDAAMRAVHVHYLEFEALLIATAFAAGALGWVLAGIVRPTPARTAIVWFAVTELVVSRLYAVPPYWSQVWPLAAIVTAALLLQIAAARRFSRAA